MGKTVECIGCGKKFVAGGTMSEGIKFNKEQGFCNTCLKKISSAIKELE